MKLLYLHIGMPKTGTSYLQNFFRENNKILEKQGFIYPDFKNKFKGIGQARNGHFLIYEGERNEEIYNTAIKHLEQLSQKCNQFILSEEGLFNNNKRIARFVEDMKKLGIEVRIIVYLRRQDLYLQSKWAQNVKETMKSDFSKFAKKQIEGLDYYEKLCFLSEIVGKENIIVRVYEKQQFIGKNKDLLSDFLETVHIGWDEEFKVLEKAKNPSLTGIYLETKRKLNSYPEFATKQNFIVPYLYEIAEKKNEVSSYSENKFFSYEQQMEFLEKYKISNEKVAKQFLGNKEGILFQEKVVNIDKEKQIYKEQDYIDVLAQVILMQRNEINDMKKSWEAVLASEREEKKYWKNIAEERLTTKISRKWKQFFN